MRTKTLLMALAALSAGVLYSNAQPVYSANIVGYANNVIPNGYTMLVSPLQASSTNNAEQVLTCLQVGDQLLFWNGSGYSIKLYGGPGQWFDGVTFNPINAPSLPMGTAFFYQNNQGVAETNTSVGTVVLTNSIAIASGYSLIGSTTPVGGGIESTNFNLPLQVGDQVLFWTGGGYSVNLYGGPGQWYNGVTFNPISTPNLTVGQGFYYQNNQGANEQWNQNVIVQ